MTLPIKTRRSRPVSQARLDDRAATRQRDYYAKKGFVEGNVDDAANADMELVQRFSRRKRTPLNLSKLKGDEN